MTTLTQHVERELKWGLSATDHHRARGLLQQQFGPAQLLRQENRFYDCADGRLRAAGTSLRLRRENQGCLLTIKSQRHTSGALHYQNEIECWLNTSYWPRHPRPLDASALPLPAALRQQLGPGNLSFLGSFANTRLQWQRSGELICLDSTRFGPHWTEWEIEIEIASEEGREAHWRHFFASQGIGLQDQQRSKLHRFFAGQEGA
ncbi:MAG: CYTH domain-containing protein [Planctomycetota bacterium]|nr:MAG: CYTH domain-containing protein [Planctomycetota bacterium]